MDVVFSIDTSGSMGGTRIQDAKDAANKFIDKMRVGAPPLSSAGVVGWNSGPRFVTNLSTDLDDVESAIDNLSTGGGTNLNVGIDLAIQVHDDADNTDTSKAIIFLSDGYGAYTPCDQPGSPAAQARDKGITIYGISIGTSGVHSFVQDMADCTGGIAYHGPSANLQAIFDDIFLTIEESTVPHNIGVSLTAASGIEDLVFTDSTDSHTNMDGGNGLMDGQTMEYDFTFTAPASSSALIDVNVDTSFIQANDKGSATVVTHTLLDAGVFVIDDVPSIEISQITSSLVLMVTLKEKQRKEKEEVQQDTRGCSCEQIIDKLGLGKGHRKFGCSPGVVDCWVNNNNCDDLSGLFLRGNQN